MNPPIVETAALERLQRLGGPRLLRQMIELFMEHGPARLKELDDGAAAGDAPAVERAAHALKSTAGNLGAERLREVAQAVESVAATGAVDAPLVARLAAEFASAETALRTALAEVDG